jgi:hypothetical protein
MSNTNDLDQPLQATPIQSVEDQVAIAIGETPAPEVSKVILPEAQNFQPLQQYYGLDDLTDKQTEQLKVVWDFYSKDAEDVGDILKSIRAAHMNMVQPEIGQTRLSQLADYVTIVKTVDSATKQKQAYQRLNSDNTRKMD